MYHKVGVFNQSDRSLTRSHWPGRIFDRLLNRQLNRQFDRFSHLFDPLFDRLIDD